MASILYFNITRPTLSDPNKDRTNSMKRGYIARVEETDHEWGAMERQSTFLATGRTLAQWPDIYHILNITDATKAELLDLQLPQYVDDTGTPVLIDNPEPTKPQIQDIYRLRAWEVMIDLLPSAITTSLATDGEATVNKADIVNYILRIRDGATHPGLT